MELTPGDLYKLHRTSMGLSEHAPLASVEYYFYPCKNLTDPTEGNVPEKNICMYLTKMSYPGMPERMVFSFLFGDTIYYIKEVDFINALKRNSIIKL